MFWEIVGKLLVPNWSNRMKRCGTGTDWRAISTGERKFKTERNHFHLIWSKYYKKTSKNECWITTLYFTWFCYWEIFSSVKTKRYLLTSKSTQFHIGAIHQGCWFETVGDLHNVVSKIMQPKFNVERGSLPTHHTCCWLTRKELIAGFQQVCNLNLAHTLVVLWNLLTNNNEYQIIRTAPSSRPFKYYMNLSFLFEISFKGRLRITRFFWIHHVPCWMADRYGILHLIFPPMQSTEQSRRNPNYLYNMAVHKVVWLYIFTPLEQHMHDNETDD